MHITVEVVAPGSFAVMFSKACMYAIRAVVLVASDRSKRWSLGAITDGTGAPEAFMAKVLQKLVHAGILVSTKGHGGGFELPVRRAAALRLGAVVSAVDGDALFSGCALGFPKCDDLKPCPVHDQVVRVRAGLKGILADTLMADLGHGLHEGDSFLKDKVG